MERYITDEAGERTAVILPVAEYEALLRAAEEADDLSAVRGVREAVARGEDEMVDYRKVREEWQPAGKTGKE